MDFVQQNLALTIAAAIVVIGLLVLGLKDLLRFSPRRAAAVASVSFRQSIRRRVLWITPLVIVGVIIVSQFQKSIDPQDTIRQLTTYSLFATGLLVTLVTIILACTNLPREIETRVIYTVATKPITRLEIVLGKVLGFAAVSFWILVIMGLFTLAYLHLQDWRLRREVVAQLASLPANDMSRPTLEYYRDRGTLHARVQGLPDQLSVLAHPPAGPNDLWSPGAQEGILLARFVLDPSSIPQPDMAEGDPVIGPTPGPQAGNPGGLLIAARVRARPVAHSAPATTQASTAPATAPTTAPAAPYVSFELWNELGETVVSPVELELREGVALPGNTNDYLQLYVPARLVEKWLPPAAREPIEVYVAITPLSAGFEYTLQRSDVALKAPGRPDQFAPEEIIFYGRKGQYGQQVRGGSPTDNSIGFYEFRNESIRPGQSEYPFELRVGIEPDRSEFDVEDATTRVTLEYVNRKSGYRTAPIELQPESLRPLYFEVPAAAVEGGDFDVIVRMLSPGWVNLRTGPMASLKLVVGDQSFAFNLLKSLSILWLMSLLVTIVSVFCSTFLSWPIAVVLTLVILSGRWGVDQLGDLTQTGVGRQIVSDMFRDTDPGTARAVSESVEVLVTMLRTVSSVLPDISVFAALEHLEKGVAIPGAVLLDSLRVALAFGLPLLVLSYIFLKYKEVAP